MTTFTYVYLPAKDSAPPVLRSADSSGGLEKDELVRFAKEYFFQGSDAAKHVETLRKASPEERNQLAEKFKEQNKSNPQLKDMPNEQILQLLEANTSASCEILCLTIPTKGNGYQSVSMYISPFTDGLTLNERASGILLACGHQLPESAGQNKPGIYGDVFIGRAYDNEEEEWKRMDFTLEDLMPNSQWIRKKKTSGGGGGVGKGAAPSLTGSMKQLQVGDSPQQKEEDLG